MLPACSCTRRTPETRGPAPWGQYQQVPKTGQKAAYFDGRSLSVKDCTEQRCAIALKVEDKSSHAEATGDLLIESDTRAVARLGSPEKCTLTLEKTAGAHPVIAVTARTGDCSYFETPGASFEHPYPLRSRAPFYSELFLPQCYIGDERAQMALCASPVLAQQEHDWVALVWKVSDLGGPRLDMQAERAKLLQGCDNAADPGACMAAAFKRSTEELQARQASWKASVTDPGDATQAQQAIASIAGTYHRTHPNGDVQGDTFKSTDTLEIRPASDDSIHFDVHLEFFNGHECNRTGVATYRANGSFAEQAQVEWAAKGTDNLCVFEIIPGPTGVQLQDPTGMCRMQDCGMRGGYVGAKFLFSDRVKK